MYSKDHSEDSSEVSEDSPRYRIRGVEKTLAFELRNIVGGRVTTRAIKLILASDRRPDLRDQTEAPNIYIYEDPLSMPDRFNSRAKNNERKRSIKIVPLIKEIMRKIK